MSLPTPGDPATSNKWGQAVNAELLRLEQEKLSAEGVGDALVTELQDPESAASVQLSATMDQSIVDAAGDPESTAGAALARTFARGVSVAEFDPDPTGAADSTAAFNEALDRGTSTFIPEGDYKITEPLQITKDSTHLHGPGVGAVLQWAGDADEYMIWCEGTLDASVANFRMELGGVGNGIGLGAGSGTNQGFRGRNLTIVSPRTGIGISPDTDTQDQVDDWLFEAVRIGGGGSANVARGFYIKSQNSTGTIFKSRVSGLPSGAAGIEIAGSLFLSVESTTFGGSASEDAESAVRMTGLHGMVSLGRVQAEKVTYFLHVADTVPSNYRPINIDACVINDPLLFEVRSRLTSRGCYFSGSAGTVYPLLILDDSRNIWTDLGSHFADAVGRTLTDYVEQNGTLNVINLVGTSLNASSMPSLATNHFATTVGGTKIAQPVGFYGAAPASKPTVSGAHGSNAALQSLLTALSNLGLITDSSS